jgi:hypothetical protein
VTLLTAIATHLPAPLVERQLAYLRALSPRSRFVVCYGGEPSEFADLDPTDAVYIDDPSLRGPHFDKSLNQLLNQLYEAFVRDEPDIEFVYLVEYDQLILTDDFDSKLVALAQASGAGLLAKHASVRNDTNWSHYLRLRSDERLSRFVAGISSRDDRELRWGCLGTGLLFARDALRTFCSLTNVPAYYCELFVPTVLYHLGFDIADVDALSNLYSEVRWLPEYSVEEAMAQKRAGRTFVHPFKRLDVLTAIADAPGPPPATGGESSAPSRTS